MSTAMSGGMPTKPVHGSDVDLKGSKSSLVKNRKSDGKVARSKKSQKSSKRPMGVKAAAKAFKAGDYCPPGSY